MAAPVIADGGSGDQNQAVDCVFKLCSLPLPNNSHPNIHASSNVVDYRVDVDAGFFDRNAFVAAMAKYLEEAAEQAKMKEQMEVGQQYACMLYTWRSCSMPIGQMKDVNNNVAEMQLKVLEILQPEIQKLKNFMAFQKSATERLEMEVQRLCRQKSEFVSEAHLLTLGRFISMLATLDELKNAKASIKNDFSFFKRSSDQVRRDPTTVTEMHDISMFLATHNVILTQVKAGLSRIAGYEDVLCSIIKTCVCWYEQKQYLLLEQKYDIIKVIGFLLYLTDGDKVNINKLKQLNLCQVDTIFKEHEVVPLFGDVVIAPFNYVQKTVNYDPQHWPRCMSAGASQQATILTRMSEYRQQHVELMCELMLLSDQRRNLLKSSKTMKKLEDASLTPDQAASLYQFSVKCVRILSGWTSHITEMLSWKLLHPAESPADAEVYERATMYNYTPEEKSALAELIGMVKNIQSQVFHLEPLLTRGIYFFIYKQLQDFMHCSLSEPLRKADKHRKEILKGTLVAVQNVCIDVGAVMKESASDSSLSQKKKTLKESAVQHVVTKPVRPSLTQLYLVRTMLESLVDKGDKAAHRHTLRKDMDGQHVTAIEKFLQQSFLWPEMMDLHGTLQKCCDLGQLWYREFYLEMTKGERIQFPIEMSLPWILMSHVLDSKDSFLIQNILYLLDLYNDSAECALRRFNKQFLYDEVEAEVNLCFEQFVYKLCEHIYVHYRTCAAQIVLNRSFRTACHRLKVPLPGARPVNYVWLLQQKNLQLMGRTVNLHYLVSQRINSNLLRSLDAAISRFEAAGFPAVVELAGLITVSREAHKLLGKFLELDDFSSLFCEANSSVSAPYGRIPLCMVLELSVHFLPHYCYNDATGRFVRTVHPFADDVKRDKTPTTAPYNLWGTKELNALFSEIYAVYQHFIGQPHFDALTELLSYKDVAVLLKELTESVRNLINSTLLPYLHGLLNVMPKRCILPRYEYTSPGVLGYFQAQLADIMAYADLQPKVFQYFREIGNAVIFAFHLEKTLVTQEARESVLSALFQHDIPCPFVAQKAGDDPKKAEAEIRQKYDILSEKFRSQFVREVISKKGTEEQVQIVRDTSLMTKEKLSDGLSIFSFWLHRLREVLANDPIWNTLTTGDGAWNIETNMEFHRIWSTMQFVFCLPAGRNPFTLEALFGEGLNWAGCALIVLLGQQRHFEALDFSYHLMRIHKVDAMDKNCNGVDLRKMVDRIRKFQILNDQVFASLNRYLIPGHDHVRPAFGVVVEHFSPPVAHCRESVA